MDDRVRLGAGEQLLHARQIQQIDVVELGGAPGKLGDALQRSFGGIREVIHDHHLVARVQQLKHSVGADIAGAAGDQNLHIYPFGHAGAHRIR